MAAFDKCEVLMPAKRISWRKKLRIRGAGTGARVVGGVRGARGICGEGVAVGAGIVGSVGGASGARQKRVHKIQSIFVELMSRL